MAFKKLFLTKKTLSCHGVMDSDLFTEEEKNYKHTSVFPIPPVTLRKKRGLVG